MKGKALFVTGTDTDVGKTWASLALMRAWQNQGWVVGGMKPVAAGCIRQEGQWVNGDALRLQQHASLDIPYQWVNPYAFIQPMSPHLACGDVEIDLHHIGQRLQAIRNLADVVIIEGAGGWYSPLDQSQFNADLARALNVPVVLVVGLRLGCINHALLSWQAIKSEGLTLLGWIGVVIDPVMSGLAGNIHFLEQRLGCPSLGILPNLREPDWACLSAQIRLDMLKF